MSNKLKASITVMINSVAQGKKAAGIRVYNLSAGEPKLITPKVIQDAAIKVIQQGDLPYPITAGIPLLRQAACDYMNQNYATNYSADECIVTTGGKFGLYLLLQYLCSADSPLKTDPTQKVGVMIPVPYWVSYPAIAKIMGAKNVLVTTTASSNWKLTPELLQEAYTPECKLLILNNGCNPTSVIYTKDELAAILTMAAKLSIMVISDEVYSTLVYSDTAYVSCASFPEHKDNVIVVQSTSKAFAMMGWRVGFIFAKPSLIEVLLALTSQSTSGVSLICQHGASAAFKNAAEITRSIRDVMCQRRDLFLSAFKESFGTDLPVPESALYVWTSLASLGVSGVSDDEFCLRALEEANVATVPGSGFGCAGYIRFSFGAEDEDIVKGVFELAKFAREFKKGS